MQELADRVWANPRFREAAARIQRSWISRELGSTPSDSPGNPEDAARIMQAAAVLACSATPEHRRLAYRAATAAYELVGTDILPLEQALRVVLGRLGNFPAFQTRADVDRALADMPPLLVAEELALSDDRRVMLRDKPFFLTAFQYDLWDRLGKGRRVAVAAPTSAGKSFVLQNHLVRLYDGDTDRTVVYLVPTRALIAQVSQDLASIFSQDPKGRPEILTVPTEPDVALSKRSICVMTQERMQLMLGAHPDFSADVVIADEAHSIADGSRGVLLQWVVDDLLRRRPDAQLLFASPGIRNLEVFGRTFGLDDIERMPSSEPTVAQNFLSVRIVSARGGLVSVHSVEPGGHETQVSEIVIGHTLASRKEMLVHVSAALGKGAANIVYANGAAEAEDVALQLSELLKEREATPDREALAQLAAESVHGSYVLAECVRHGIAFHYSTIPTQVRQAIEKAVSDGVVDFLVCTSTLLQGVNLPARNVFMCKPEKGRTHPLEATDFWNLAGRAGRLRREFQGNIFLIDYEAWKVKPLDQPRDSVIVPAIETGVTDRRTDLVATITRDGPQLRDDPDVETIFVRLFDDLERGDLSKTMDRFHTAGIDPVATGEIATALIGAATEITLPAHVLRRSPSISPHKQQDLYRVLERMAAGDRAKARALIPAHPRESGAYDSYAAVLKLCNMHLVGLPETDRRHRFQALMATFWMSGEPLPRIIERQIIRGGAEAKSRKIIRDVLDAIEKIVRFEAVRLLSCYCGVLLQLFEDIGMPDLATSVPPISLYLEVGASDRTMISLIAVGLSRASAAILNDAAVDKNMDVAAAKNWLKTRPLEVYGLSPLLLEEANRIAREC
ncbi:DEAD/DEAH box helicase [Sinorhizobium sp. 7-81]|uniref:DEAD/DEAH box helicase n=1 Tax=Sinorhizobium sp. 8-89 TaxID=3049089 RepID=UPI0024C28B0E|nr:DEAD/DEAH box helicase [Sinorhizobium sp. 8-89]MDK1492958.1 DEAD/DEAH box helicase [Sinorhizobium sp. 8-89]